MCVLRTSFANVQFKAVYVQALVCLSNTSKSSTQADVKHLFTKWRTTVVFSNCLGQIYVAI